MWYKIAQDEWEQYRYDPAKDFEEVFAHEDNDIPPDFILKEMSLEDRMQSFYDSAAKTKEKVKPKWQVYAYPSPKDRIWKYLLFEPGDMDDYSLEGTAVPHTKHPHIALGWIKKQLARQGKDSVLLDYYNTLSEACKDSPELMDCNQMIDI